MSDTLDSGGADVTAPAVEQPPAPARGVAQDSAPALGVAQVSAPGVEQASAPGVEQAPALGGLVQLGSADAVVCEGDLCWVPDSSPR